MFVRTWMSTPVVSLDDETLIVDALEVMTVRQTTRWSTRRA